MRGEGPCTPRVRQGRGKVRLQWYAMVTTSEEMNDIFSGYLILHVG